MTQPIAPEYFEIPCKDGLTIRGDAYLAESPLGTVVICHGFKGFAHWSFFPYLAQTLAQARLTALTFDFSGSGIGRDRESFTEAEAFADNTFTRDLEDLELLRLGIEHLDHALALERFLCDARVALLTVVRPSDAAARVGVSVEASSARSRS